MAFWGIWSETADLFLFVFMTVYLWLFLGLLSLFILIIILLNLYVVSCFSSLSTHNLHGIFFFSHLPWYSSIFSFSINDNFLPFYSQYFLSLLQWFYGLLNMPLIQLGVWVYFTTRDAHLWMRKFIGDHTVLEWRIFLGKRMLDFFIPPLFLKILLFV